MRLQLTVLYCSRCPFGNFGVLMMVVCMFWVYTLTVNVVLLPTVARQIQILLVRVFSGLPPCVG